MNAVGVMHLTDTLDAGGAERVAVNLVNLLPRERYMPHLCTTRRDGLLAGEVCRDVGRLRLGRRRRIEPAAILRLAAYIRQHQVVLLHAHSTSLFTAMLARCLVPRTRVIWHDHFGRSAVAERSVRLYRLATRGAGGVIAVNQPLVEWSRRRLHVPPERIWYLPNFVCPPPDASAVPALPGTRGRRIVCVANFRPQKDHATLLHALDRVVREVGDAQLLLVGAPVDPAYLAHVRALIAELGLERHVAVLGQRADVPAVLRACDIGVLSSASEGSPLALIEYGVARLPVVATRVGQCADVLDNGRCGVLVSSGDASELAAALVALLRSDKQRAKLGQAFGDHVELRFSPAAVIGQLCAVYDTVIEGGAS